MICLDILAGNGCIWKGISPMNACLLSQSVFYQVLDAVRLSSLMLVLFKETHCLAYRYRYQPKFYNWVPVFLEKAQTTGMKENLFAAGIFLVVIFLFLCDIVAICLCLTYRVIMV